MRSVSSGSVWRKQKHKHKVVYDIVYLLDVRDLRYQTVEVSERYKKAMFRLPAVNLTQ